MSFEFGHRALFLHSNSNSLYSPSSLAGTTASSSYLNLLFNSPGGARFRKSFGLLIFPMVRVDLSGRHGVILYLNDYVLRRNAGRTFSPLVRSFSSVNWTIILPLLICVHVIGFVPAAVCMWGSSLANAALFALVFPAVRIHLLLHLLNMS